MPPVHRAVLKTVQAGEQKNKPPLPTMHPISQVSFYRAFLGGWEIQGLMLFYFFPSPYQVKNNNFWRTTVTKVSTHLCNFQPQICFFFEKSTACFFSTSMEKRFWWSTGERNKQNKSWNRFVTGFLDMCYFSISWDGASSASTSRFKEAKRVQTVENCATGFRVGILKPPKT